MDPEKSKALRERFVKVEISFENPKWVLFYDLLKREYVQVWNVAELWRLTKGGGGGYYKECSGMCGLTQLRRPHFTCITKCRLKKVRDGELPAVDPVYPITFMARKNRPKWKRWLSRKLASLYEWFIT